MRRLYLGTWTLTALLAASACAPSGGATTQPPVRPAAVVTAGPAVHITEYAATPAEGRARCLDDLSYYPPGKADCRVEVDGPESRIDVSQPGWARQFGPVWAK